MANVWILSLLVVVTVVNSALASGYMNYGNWGHFYRCPGAFMQSNSRYYVPYLKHAQVLDDLEAIDKDNNDDVTEAELSDLSAMNLDLVTGVTRCQLADMFNDRYGIKPALGSHFFTMADTNQDGVYNTADVAAPGPDTNGDGKTSVCEMYTAFLDTANRAGKEEYDLTEKTRQILDDTDYYMDKPATNWQNMNWHNMDWQNMDWKNIDWKNMDWQNMFWNYWSK